MSFTRQDRRRVPPECDRKLAKGRKGGGTGEKVDEDQNAIRVWAEVDLLLRQISHYVVDCRPAPRRQVDQITPDLPVKM